VDTSPTLYATIHMTELAPLVWLVSTVCDSGEMPTAIFDATAELEEDHG